MSLKEIRAHLKKAKAAIDKQDFQEAKRCCQDVFQLDEKNYMALVFAGLACLKLSDYKDSKHHYKTAIIVQPDGALAWKGFADYHDKCKPVITADQSEAIQTYTKLLSFIESDLVKTRSTYFKLIALHREFNQQEQVIECYTQILSTYDKSCGDLSVSDSNDLSKTWLEFGIYLMTRDAILNKDWVKFQASFHIIQEDTAKQDLRSRVVKQAYERYLGACEFDKDLRMFLEEECGRLIEDNWKTSLPILLHITLMQTLPSSFQEMTERKIVLSEVQRHWISQLSVLTLADGGGGGCGDGSDTHACSLGLVGQALVSMTDGKWMEASDTIKKCVPVCVLPECWLLSSFLHLFYHDYNAAEKAATNGLTFLKNSAKFLFSRLEANIRLCQCQAFIGQGNTKKLTECLAFLSKQSHEDHMTAVLVRAHLSLNDIPSAETLLEEPSRVKEMHSISLLGLQAEIAIVKQDYEAAMAKILEALEHCPNSPWLLFTRAKVLWEHPERVKSTVYAALLQAAKADPNNPDIFFHLGDYHKALSGNLKRAEKCYLKTLSLQPSHCGAAMSLADILWENEEQERAYEVYRDISSIALPQSIKMAWLRIGLFQKERGQYDEAIKSFQIVLSYFEDDKHCWECLGEAYLARGSFNSALKTFTMCLQLNPDSLHCQYRIAHVKQMLGLLQEAIDEYSNILEREKSYIPACIGRGESYFKLAQSVLRYNFDGRAVDHVSAALADLTLAARIRPEFNYVWKLLGDSCTCVYPLSPIIARPLVPSVLRRGKLEPSESESVRVEKQELLEIGCRCYERVLQMNQDAPHFWHDLSLANFYLAKCLDARDPMKEQKFATARKAAEKAVDLKPTDSNYWNTLGVTATLDGTDDPGLVQHSFIRSLQEQDNAMAWSNLGTLYLKYDDTELAYEAFRKAQACSPDSVQAWIGQAMVAERIGSSESMGLFRHATELEYHPEASIGYSYWVCQTFQSVPLKMFVEHGGVELKEVAHQRMLQARDSLEKLACREASDPCILNYLGLLYEQEGLQKVAEKMFTRALRCCHGVEQKELIIKYNLARVQSALGNVTTATSCLKAISEEWKNSDICLDIALALFRENCLKESEQAYEQYIMSTNQKDETKKSAVLTAQAMVAFANGDRDSCQNLLFQAFQTTPTCLHGLVALCALSYLDNNTTILQATLQELDKIVEWQPVDIYLLHPTCVQALHVVKYLLTSINLDSCSSDCADIITQLIQKIPEQHETIMPLPLPLNLQVLVSSTGLVHSQAQKLVHSYPENVWALAILLNLINDAKIKNSYKIITQDLVESQLMDLSSTKAATMWKSSALAALKTSLL